MNMKMNTFTEECDSLIIHPPALFCEIQRMTIFRALCF